MLNWYGDGNFISPSLVSFWSHAVLGGLTCYMIITTKVTYCVTALPTKNINMLESFCMTNMEQDILQPITRNCMITEWQSSVSHR